MRKIVVIAVALLGMYSVSMAQAPKTQQKSKTTKKKTTVVKKEGSSQTVIEIKNGDVFVNGEKIADASDRNNGVYQKVIIDNNCSGDMPPEPPAPPMPPRYDDRPAMKRRAMLGVYTKNVAKGDGAQIAQIAPNSAASKAGLQDGDRITGVDEQTITNPDELVAAIKKHEPGDKVKITYTRDGKNATTEATLAAAEQNRDVRIYRRNYNGDEDMDMQGMGIPKTDIPDMPGMDMPGSMPNGYGRQHREYSENEERGEHRERGEYGGRGHRDHGPKMGVTAEDRPDGEGVKITDVKPSSPADESGIKDNDIITQFGDQKINSVADLQDAISQLKPNEKKTITIDRKGKTVNLDFSIKKPVEKRDL